MKVTEKQKMAILWVIVVLNIVLLLVALSQMARSSTVEQDTKKEYPVTLLFEHEGCKIYKFYDKQFRYFSKCE